MRRAGDLFAAFAFLGLGCTAHAQCALQWVPQTGQGSVQGTVYAAVEWDPDGSGPRGALIVLGGAILAGGTTQTSNLVGYDPATGTWDAMGGGCDGIVFALAVLPNGELVAGGRFQQAGSTLSPGIARWNGTTWSAFGSGIGEPSVNGVQALAVLPNGDLVAGGVFTSIAGVAARNIARWDGTTWFPLASGVAWPGATLPYVESVTALAALPNGDVVAGGWFTSAGGTPAVGIARWNGTTWSALGASLNSAVLAILPMPNGDLVVGGPFGSAGGATAIGIARWNGATWSALGSGMLVPNGHGEVHGLARLQNGDVIATGIFATAGGTAAANIARWNGTAWSALGTGLTSPSLYRTGQVLRLLGNGALLVGGGFTAAGGVNATGVALWTGAWAALTSGWDGRVLTFTRRSNGALVAGGMFTSADTVAANRVAEWNGAWAPLGAGTNDTVRALTIAGNGDVVAAGDFTIAGGAPANHVARWNGTAWSAMGAGLLGTVRALATLPNGDVVAGGNFPDPGGAYVLRWNGTAWTPLGGSFSPGYGMTVRALAVMPNGDLVAAGNFNSAGGVPASNIARWDGAAWSAMDVFWGDIEALAVLDTGDLVASGQFTFTSTIVAPHVARWNGSVWLPMNTSVGSFGSSDSYNALLPLPGGQLLLGGRFTLFHGMSAANLVRWDGSSWTAMPGTAGPIDAMSAIDDATFAVGGGFTAVGGQGSPWFAKLAAPCPANATVAGNGCVGSGGMNVLTPNALPWLGSTCRSVATGMPALGLAVAIAGFAPTAIPLPTILPQGGAGCSLLASPDVLSVLLPSGGRATTAIAIPNQPALVGIVFREQVAALELDPVGNLVAATTTNALVQVIGTL